MTHLHQHLKRNRNNRLDLYLIGSKNVGKSALISRFQSSPLPLDLNNNRHPRNKVRLHELSSKDVLQFVKDEHFLHEHCGFMFVYSVDDQDSLEQAQLAYRTLLFLQEEQGFTTRLSAVIVGTKYNCPLTTDDRQQSERPHDDFSSLPWYLTTIDENEKHLTNKRPLHSHTPFDHLIQMVHDRYHYLQEMAACWNDDQPIVSEEVELSQQAEEETEEQEEIPENNSPQMISLPSVASMVHVAQMSTSITVPMSGQEQPSATEPAVTPRLNVVPDPTKDTAADVPE